MRSGALIQKVSIAEVPTGYLGPETDDENRTFDEKTPRESLSRARRFAVFKRDDYRCRLCGRSQADGIVLHVDHRIPVAKNGSNEDGNLWTLCEDCNLGKSDADL
jgi:5-methylcytosine-specific restriction endonuclease McrA